MIEKFTKRWFSHNHIVREQFEKELPNHYTDIVKAVITMLDDACAELHRLTRSVEALAH